MRYNLGCMDTYPIEAAGSVIENCPMYKVVFKNFIDPIRLESAVKSALKEYPLFATSVGFDREYYLKDNSNPLVILNCKEHDRPSTFGKSTNGYPWRICIKEKEMCLEWLHGVTDGVGVQHFLKLILCAYFNVQTDKKPSSFLVAPGLEPFYDPKEKGINYEVDPQGFKNKDFPEVKHRGYVTDCHKLVCDTNEVINLARVCKSSVVPIITILFSKALRMNIPKEAKNRNVSCNIVLDIRRILNYETMHNCIDIKRLTYIDEYDKMNLSSVSKIYKAKLDTVREQKNIVRAVTDRIKQFNWIHIFKTKFWLKSFYKYYGPLYKYDDCNFSLTYLGRFNFPAEVMEQLDDIEVKVWHDFGACNIACNDFKGKLNVNICENYVNKNVVNDFIKLAKKYGIRFKQVEYTEFRQSHFEE